MGPKAVGLCVWLAASLPVGLAAQRVYAPPIPSSAEAESAHPALPLAQQSSRISKLPPQESIDPAAITPDPLIAGHDLEVGTFYYHRGDYPGALARFQDAIANDPSLAEAYCRAGDTELQLKRLAPARHDWQGCLKVAGEGSWAAHARKALAKHPTDGGR